MSFETQKKDNLETGKYPCITKHMTKDSGASGKALVRGQVVKLDSNKVAAFAKADTKDIYGVMVRDAASTDKVAIVYITGAFNVSAITATGRSASETKILLVTTLFSELRGNGLFFEDSQSITDSFS